MPSNDISRLQTLFAEALELPEEARAAFLQRACAGAPALLHEVRALLATDAALAGMTARPAVPEAARRLDAMAPSPSFTGLRVGPFALREELGGGGMGRVYRAERVDGTVAQEVAIKFVRRELLDANTFKRFQLERQVLATLDHPHIARLLDAAQLEDGTPYYVMEYVAGVPITEYCKRERLDVRARVALLCKVCGAVAEAHRELIVHRDLKPSNLLVDAKGTPKLLDFGIAKLLDARSDGALTGTADRFFSPHYVAPEQLTGAPVGVACDVYALGLLLYELLTGRQPFVLAEQSAAQIERLITQVPPPAPSVSLGAHSPEGIRARQLRGDLDGIVLRCLRKAPNERYASVERLETDLRNYLEGRPVQARGGHRWYRARKFVRRNLLAVSATSLLALSLIGGVLAFAWQARVAEQRAEELQQVADFQGEMLAQLDPARAGKLLVDDVIAKLGAAMMKAQLPDSERKAQAENFAAQWQRINATDVAVQFIDGAILTPATEAIAQQFAEQPIVEATLNQALSERYQALGLYDAARPLQERALAIRRRVLGDDHPRTLHSLGHMAVLLSSQRKPADAEAMFRETLDRSLRVLGDEHRDTLRAINNVGNVLSRQGKLDEAEPYYRSALEKRRAVLGDDDADTLTSLHNMGALSTSMGRLDEADRYFGEALAGRRRVLGEDAPNTLITLNMTGVLRFKQGRLDDAESYFRESFERNRRVLGEAHPSTLTSLSNVGAVLVRRGALTEAEPFVRQALDLNRRTLGEEHPATLNSRVVLADLSRQQGRLDESESQYRQVIEQLHRVLGEHHIDTLKAVSGLAAVVLQRGRSEEALRLLQPVEPDARRVLGRGNERPLARHLHGQGEARLRLGQYAKAESYLLEAHALLLRVPEASRDDVLLSTRMLADLYAQWQAIEPAGGHADEAEDWKRQLERLLEPMGK